MPAGHMAARRADSGPASYPHGVSRPWAAEASPRRPRPINIDKADYDAFEARLTEIQDAYGRGDVGTLRRLATPEMAENFAQEIAANTRRGVIDKVSGAKLIQGDLSEAWREAGAEYATVAMRYSVLNPIVDQATGRIVSGSATMPGGSDRGLDLRSVPPAGARAIGSSRPSSRPA